jgi:ectoine hydroxylase-related dioxygenase (phytanoyl-CoA dioxygenase family)
MAGIWVALHDVTEGMGRLKLLPRSHKEGVRNVLPANGVGGVQCEIFAHETTWHVSDVEQGDVTIFHSCCMHKAEPNTTRETVRISIDTRFCDYGAAVFPSNMEPHHGWRIDGFDWDSIYKEWTDPDLQYYWQSYTATTQ